MKKRILTVLLAVCLVVALGTVTAWAENGECYGGEDCDHEASIGNIHYDTLQGAINAAEDMDSDGVVTIDMLSDVTLTGTAVLFDTPGSYILDLGNNTLSSGLADIIMVKAGDLELTVRNGKMEGTANNTYGIYVYNDKDNNAGYDDVTVIVDGIEMNCGDQALGVQGLNSNNNLIVKNSTIDCETTAIYFPPMSGELIIENSDITGVGNGIVIKGGSLTVRGDSNIKATGESKIQDAPYGGKTEGIGFPQTGATIYVEGGYDAKGSSEPRPIEVNIEGGTFESTQGQSLRIDFTESGGSQTVNITGGTFKNDIENSGAGDAKISGATIEGKVQNTDTGTVSVVNSVVNEIGENVLVYNSTVGDKQEFTTGDSIAIVDGVIYSDLASAISAATDGDTVEIIGDCTLDSSVAITKNITINGNGNTVTAEGAAFYIQADLEYFTVENLTLIGKLGEGKVYGEGNDATSGPWMGIGTYTPYFCGVRDLTLNNVVIDGFSYGLYFASSSSNTNPVSIDADNLVIKNCGIKGAYFEKLTDSTFTNCEFLDNGTDDSKVDSNFQSWMCGVDVNLKYGDYESIVFEDCTFEGNGDNNGTALHIKARDDGANYGADPATLDGVTVTGCTFVGNNATNTDGVSFGPIVIGEPNANNQTPTNVSIQPGVSFTNNLAEGSTYTVAYEGDGINEPTVIVNANSEITLPAPTRNGYTFGGWRGSDGKIYKGDQTVAITSDMTFTAIWNAINIPDTYDIDLIVSDGGEAKTNFSNASAGTTITVTLPRMRAMSSTTSPSTASASVVRPSRCPTTTSLSACTSPTAAPRFRSRMSPPTSGSTTRLRMFTPTA